MSINPVPASNGGEGGITSFPVAAETRAVVTRDFLQPICQSDAVKIDSGPSLFIGLRTEYFKQSRRLEAAEFNKLAVHPRQLAAYHSSLKFPVFALFSEVRCTLHASVSSSSRITPSVSRQCIADGCSVRQMALNDGMGHLLYFCVRDDNLQVSERWCWKL